MAFAAFTFSMSGCAATTTSYADAPDSKAAPTIIAIGDLHGDFKAYQALMLDAGLIGAKGKWRGGETIFVQTGDIPDRGPDSAKIIDHLRKLQKQARKKGGEVITLVGNHEAMNMTGDLRYVDEGEYAAFADRQSRALRDRLYESNQSAIAAFYRERDAALTPEDIRKAWEAENPLGKFELQQAWSPDGSFGKWIIGNPAVAIVGDSMFVHGGMSPKYSAYTTDQINAMTRSALKAQETDPDSIINDELGPLWYRGLVTGQANAISGSEIDDILQAYGVGRIVIGHTPALTGIKSLHGGRVIQIDTGISDYYGGTRSYLRIENSQLYAHDDGAVREIQ